VGLSQRRTWGFLAEACEQHATRLVASHHARALKESTQATGGGGEQSGDEESGPRKKSKKTPRTNEQTCKWV